MSMCAGEHDLERALCLTSLVYVSFQDGNKQRCARAVDAFNLDSAGAFCFLIFEVCLWKRPRAT